MLSSKESVIIDGYGKTKEKRLLLRKKLEKHGVKTVLIYVKEEEEIILERLKERDKKNGNNNWIKSFAARWKPTFEESSNDECELLIETSSRDVKDVVEKIKKYISKR